jgi:hypothetical protein
MQFLMDLWLPIVLSGVAVFFYSALAWMVLPHHKKEWQPFPNEDAVMGAVRAGNLPGGLYHFPHAADPKAMQTAEFQQKMNAGVIAYVTVVEHAGRGMGGTMIKSLLGNLVVSVFVAYVLSLTMQAGAEYMAVFRVAGTVAFMAFGLGQIQESVWFGRPWKAYLLGSVDALISALLVAGVFGWRWV